MAAFFRVISAFTSTPVTLNPLRPLEDFQRQFSQAIEKSSRGDALLLLSAAGPLLKQNSPYFTELLIQYLETPNQIERVCLICSLLGLFDLLTPFGRLAEIAANLSLRNYQLVDRQIHLTDQFLKESDGPRFTVYVQEQLEFFQVERRWEIVMLLTHLQHYLHKEPPYDKDLPSLIDTSKKV